MDFLLYNPMKSDMQIIFICAPEPDNEHDKEAIKVMVEGLGHVGYVANSPHTVLGESMSAGRIYDRIGKKAYGKVKFVTDQGIVCKLSKKSEND